MKYNNEIKLKSTTHKNVNISYTKGIKFLNNIRDKNYKEVIYLLNNSNTQIGSIIIKLINSALYSVINYNTLKNGNLPEFNFKKEDFKIKEIFINPGHILKRMRPRAKGRSYVIQKKTSHITVVLSIKKITLEYRIFWEPLIIKLFNFYLYGKKG